MKVDEIKQDIKKEIAVINRSFPKYWWSKSFNNKIMEDNIPVLQYCFDTVLFTFKFHRVGLIIFLVVSAGLSIFSFYIKEIVILKGYDFSNDFNVKFFSDLNNFYLLGIFTLGWMITTFRSYRIKENLKKKIFLLQVLDKMDK